MIDEIIFRNVLKEIKQNSEYADDIIDSFSDNQFIAKRKVLEYANRLNILDKDSEVIIFGSWYGSILIPGLVDKVKKISCIDIDKRVLQTAKNRFFKDYTNIDYIAGNVFDLDLKRYHTANLFINTSCEHMPSMKEFLYWPDQTHFVFTSNDMFNIEGHINCVNSLDEFKEQLPERAEVLYEEEVEDTRGTRYILVGKINGI